MDHSGVPVVDVGPHNVEQTGFFCLMSRRKSEGYRRKREWLDARFSEGLRLRMLQLPNRGFIEYLPGEAAWRPVVADGYLFIHCLWVVGRSKGNGYATMLLDDCLSDARTNGFKGVAMVSSEKVWLVGKGFLEQHGFEVADTDGGTFHLMAQTFDGGDRPRFVEGLRERRERHAEGLTVIRSDQCPYIEDAADIIARAAGQRGLPFRVLEMTSSDEVRREAVSPFGLFSIIYGGRLLSYHYLTEKQLLERADAMDSDPALEFD